MDDDQFQIFLEGLRSESRGASGRDWYAVGSIFPVAEHLLECGKARLDCPLTRLVTVIDYASDVMVACRVLPGPPAALSSEQLVNILEGAFEAFGRPTVGVVFSHSCWLGSEGLMADPDTRESGYLLAAVKCEFPQMSEGVETQLEQWGQRMGLKISFHGDEIVDI